MEQTIQAGDAVSVIVNVVDDTGSHVAATIATATTRLQKGNAADTTWDSATPTVDTITTGVYRINFSSLSPAVAVSHNADRLRVKINGSIDGGSAWTEFHLPLRVEMSDSSLGNLEASAGQITQATATGSYTTTTLAASGLASTANDHWNGRLIIFTSGTLAGQATRITDYVDSTRTFTFTAITAAPSGNTFVIV